MFFVVGKPDGFTSCVIFMTGVYCVPIGAVGGMCAGLA